MSTWTLPVQASAGAESEVAESDVAESRPPDPAALPLERVEAEICTLAGQIAAATCRFLRLLAEFDAREGWAGWQVKSCAHWLSWRCGMDLRTAHEHVRVARALARLPRITEAFGDGRLSYSKVRALTRVATAQTEPDLVAAALCAPASQLERLVRGLQTASDDTNAGRRRAGVRWRWDDDGSLVIWGRLDPDDGARLLAGLTRMEHERSAMANPPNDEPAPARPKRSVDGERSAERVGPAGGPVRAAGGPVRAAGGPVRAEADSPECSAERSAHRPNVGGGVPTDLGPALVAAADLARATVEMPIHAPGAEVVVHVDVDTFVETAREVDAPEVQRQRDSAKAQAAKGRPTPRRPGRGRRRLSRLDDGPSLRSAMLQALACDGRIQLSVDGPDGRTLDLGRRRRRPTNRQIVALWRRDRGCAVPGCGRTRFLHAHHVRPWALGGKTDLDNLVLLCGEHHRLLHRGAFSIVALGAQRFRFRGTDRIAVPAAPAVTGRAATLTAAHPEITPGTIEPDWDGSELNLHDAVGGFLAAWASEAGSGAAHATEPTTSLVTR